MREAIRKGSFHPAGLQPKRAPKGSSLQKTVIEKKVEPRAIRNKIKYGR